MPRQAQAEETQEIDVYEIVFGHIEDAYEWHITDIGDASIRIPLPVIVKSSSGWHIFSSARLRNQARYEGLYIAPDGEYKNKIVEKDATGEEIRPFDISITKKRAGTVRQQRHIGGHHAGMCALVQASRSERRGT